MGTIERETMSSDKYVKTGTPAAEALGGLAIIKLEAAKSIEDADREVAHIRADEALCELLLALGYSDVVDAFEDIGKWYA